jgi:SAM-dependent methyltransferase
MVDFKDHFFIAAKACSQHRPHYPTQLFAYLASIAHSLQNAWDCATGSGQAAVGLRRHFKHVVASDASRRQVDNAITRKGVYHLVATAEQTPIGSRTIDLVTVAQAMHWFDRDIFFQEVERVLKDKGILAVWTYDLLRVIPAIDGVLSDFYTTALGRYWPPERGLIESGYREIHFPFDRIDTPDFTMMHDWDLNQLFGYLGTWSAVKRFEKAEGDNPLDHLLELLLPLWGHPARRRCINWPLTLHIRINNTIQ